MRDELGLRIAQNLKQLRVARGLTQAQLAKLAGVPRATWTNLESGAANPTVSVLHKVATALQVTTEELLAPGRASVELSPFGSLPTRTRGKVQVRKLLPHVIAGMELERIEVPAGERMTGIPHTPGTREYLACEAGELELVASGERWVLKPGDVIAFRGDQRHSYASLGHRSAIGYSVVVLAPG